MGNKNMVSLILVINGLSVFFIFMAIATRIEFKCIDKNGVYEWEDRFGHMHRSTRYKNNEHEKIECCMGMMWVGLFLFFIGLCL